MLILYWNLLLKLCDWYLLWISHKQGHCVRQSRETVVNNHSKINICVSFGWICPISVWKLTFLSSQSIPLDLPLVVLTSELPSSHRRWYSPGQWAMNPEGFLKHFQNSFPVVEYSWQPTAKQKWGLIDYKQGWDPPEKLSRGQATELIEFRKVIKDVWSQREAAQFWSHQLRTK